MRPLATLPVLALTLALTMGVVAAVAQDRPNVVVILADDLGWSDLGAYGNPFIETPNLDRLAAEGLLFTAAYAASPVCSPTRASLQTGRYPARLGMNAISNPHRRPWARLLPPENRWSLPPDVLTLAEALAPAGYTSAIPGKWNLGYDAPDLAADRGYAQPPADVEGLNAAYGADVAAWAAANPHKGTGPITVQAIRFMEAQAAAGGPFLLFVSYFAPHIKSEAREELVEKYRAKAEGAETMILPRYAAMVEAMDEGVEHLLRALDVLGLADDTLVLFTSDNGGLIQVYHGGGPIVTTNAPLRAEKGTLYEGGIRVPMVARWPGRVAAGTTSDVPVISNDLFPTLLDAAGLEPAATDGVSLVPLLERGEALGREALYWHYPFYHHATPAAAIREGRYKLIEWYETGAVELFDLEDDPGERRDLAAAQPVRAHRLRQRLHQWQADVGAAMPTENSRYDPSLAHLWGRRPDRPWLPPPPGALDMEAELRKLFD